MNQKRRLVAGLAIGWSLTLVSLVFSIVMLRHGHQRGWAAINVTPVLKSKDGRTVQMPRMLKDYKPQSIMMMFGGAPGAKAGLRLGDKIISIDGIPYENTKALVALDARVNSGDRVVYRIERDGRQFDVPVIFESPLRHRINIAQVVVQFVVGMTFLIIGSFIFSRRPEDRRAVVFYILTVVSAVSMLGLMAAMMINSSLRGITTVAELSTIVIVILGVIGMSFLPLTLHLALIFPKDRPIVHRVPVILRWVYGVPLLAAGSMLAMIPVVALLRMMKRGAMGTRATAGALATLAILASIVVVVQLVRRRGDRTRRHALASRPATLLTIVLLLMIATVVLLGAAALRLPAVATMVLFPLLGCLAVMTMPIISCVALYRSYHDANLEERRQVVWPLWGTIIALGFRVLVFFAGIGIAAYTAAVGGDALALIEISQYAELLARAVYLLIPISFAAAILKYKLMNIDVLIRKTVVYTILSGAILFVYIVLVGGLGTVLIRVVGVKNQTMVMASTLVVALLFFPLRSKLQTLVDRNLFRHKYDYAAALRAIASEALAAHDAPSFLQSAAEKLQPALQNRSVVIFVPRHDEFVATAKVGVADTLLGNLRVSAGAFGPMLDRPFDPRRRTLSAEAINAVKRTEAVLIVPVNTPGTPPNGFIALGPKLSGRDFDVEDIDFVRSIADQIDIGLDRVRMQRDDADFAQARAIQQTLLPREMPRVQGLEVSGEWQPARTVGGDYFDLLKLSENELAVCIGDVAGKGMPAALLMSGLQAAVRASESRSPRELCERVRRVVVSSLSGGRFVTFFYAVLDTAAMRLRFCNAGQTAPILVRVDGRIERLDQGGPAFSRLFRGAYSESELPLEPGDRLVLFTDGASEAGGTRGEMFGEERLAEVVVDARTLGARELKQVIIDAVLDFNRGELEDDLTLVVAAVSQPA